MWAMTTFTSGKSFAISSIPRGWMKASSSALTAPGCCVSADPEDRVEKAVIHHMVSVQGRVELQARKPMGLVVTQDLLCGIGVARVDLAEGDVAVGYFCCTDAV
jgi:hypothetical protein